MKKRFISITIAGVLVFTAGAIAAPQKGTMTDPADGKKYRTVTVGEQTWMAENMSLSINGSICYDNKEANCRKYGRLYVWDALPYVCPDGWHLPQVSEWESLFENAGGRDKAAALINAKNTKIGLWDSGKFIPVDGNGIFGSLHDREGVEVDTVRHVRSRDYYAIDLNSKNQLSSVCKAYAIRCVKGDAPEKQLRSDIEKVLKDVNLKTRQDFRKNGPLRFDLNKLIDFCNSERSGGIGDGLAGLFGGGDNDNGGLASKIKCTIKVPSASEIVVKGAIDSESVMKVLRQRAPGLRHIYNKFLKKNPGFQGKIVLEFVVDANGRIVQMSVVSSSTGFPEFEDDVVKAVRNWTFPKVDGGNSTVTIPFVFEIDQ